MGEAIRRPSVHDVFFCVIAFDGLGLNHDGRISALEVGGFVGHGPRHVTGIEKAGGTKSAKHGQ